jgi:hypothetical protein
MSFKAAPDHSRESAHAKKMSKGAFVNIIFKGITEPLFSSTSNLTFGKLKSPGPQIELTDIEHPFCRNQDATTRFLGAGRRAEIESKKKLVSNNTMTS